MSLPPSPAKGKRFPPWLVERAWELRYQPKGVSWGVLIQALSTNTEYQSSVAIGDYDGPTRSQKLWWVKMCPSKLVSPPVRENTSNPYHHLSEEDVGLS